MSSLFQRLARRYIVPSATKRGGLRLCFDIEADELLDAATVTHCIVVADLDIDQIDEYGPDRIADALAHLTRADYLTGHNIQAYDIPLLRRLYGWVPAANTEIMDTLIAGRLILPNLRDIDDEVAAMGGGALKKLRGRYSVEAWGARLGVAKVGVDIENFSVWTPELQARCVGDVKTAKALWHFLESDGYSAQALELEHRTNAICNLIEQTGVPFNDTAAERLEQKWSADLIKIRTALKEQFPSMNPSSRQQVAKQLEARGWIPEEHTEKTGQAKITDDLLETIPQLYPEFASLADYHILKRRIAQLSTGKKAWRKNVGKDGRLHGGTVHIGTPHSRASHFGPNLAQVPNPKRGTSFASECRALFQAPEGWSFVACDQATLQDRTFAHYLTKFDNGAYAKAFLAGVDQHWKGAIVLELIATGTARDEHNKVHTLAREGAKIFRYGFLFGAQKKRAGQIINKIARNIQHADPANGLYQKFFAGAARPSEETLTRIGRQALDKFEAGTPGLRQLRQTLRSYADAKKYLLGLDGRRVPIRALHSALNFIVTSAEAIVCKRWLVQVYDELYARFRYGWDGDVVIPLWIHDEIACCCRSEIAAEVGEIMVRHAKAAGEFYGLRVPLDADFKVSQTWAGESDSADNVKSSTDTATETPPAYQVDWAAALARDFPFASNGRGATEIPIAAGAEPAPTEDDDARIRLRMAEKGIPWENPSLAAQATTPPVPPPSPSLPKSPSSPPPPPPLSGNSRDDGFAAFTSNVTHNGNGAARTTGSKTAAERDTYAKERAGEPFNDAYLRTQGYRLAHIFDYTLPDGTLINKQNRYELRPGVTPTKKRPRKRFLPHRIVNGNDVLGAGDRRVIYNWPTIMRAGPGNFVFIPEGENKAKVLIDAGLLATTVLSHKWAPECVAALNGYHAIILADHDEDGNKLASAAQRALASVAASTRIVPAIHLWKHLPGGKEPELHDDVVNWIAAGGDPAKLLDICREIPVEDFELNEWDAGDLLDSGLPPPRQWLYGRQLCRRFLSSLVAPGDVGKTTKRLTQAIELATGRELLGHRIYQRCHVLMISLEDDRDELWRRLLAICKHHNVDPAEFKGWLFCRDLNGVKLVEEIGSKRRLGMLEPMLRKAIERRRPDAVILDPFVKLHALDENKNPDMDFVCSQLIKLAQDYNIAVDSPAHTRKGQLVAGDADNRRGATAQRDAGRLDYTLTAMTEVEAKQFGIDPNERKSYVRLDRAKANIVRAIKASWYHLVNIPIDNATELYPEGDEVQALEAWTPPDPWIDLDATRINQILDKIDAGLPDGNRYSSSGNAKNRAVSPIIIAVIPEKTEAEAREIIRGWLKAGLLIERDYENPIDRKKAKGLYVDPAKRPITQETWT